MILQTPRLGTRVVPLEPEVVYVDDPLPLAVAPARPAKPFRPPAEAMTVLASGGPLSRRMAALAILLAVELRREGQS